MKINTVIEENYNSFLKFNGMKLERFQQLFAGTNIKRVINSIPAILSMNDKKVPGYIDDRCPCGIAGYSPDAEVIRYIKGRFSADYVSPKGGRFIEMLAVMGSVGTIAYNKRSDFDYWAVIDRSKTDEKGLVSFSKKVEEVQKWAEKEAGVEVHIFINDVHNLKQNIFAEDDEEGFGSTVGAVLKDEFFRSSIIIAGKIPFWWVVPKFVTDDEYDKIFENIPEEERDEKFVDIGNLYKISKDDFLGAALFQLIKAIGNPFKSILKIGILEKYLFSDDNALILSQRVKTAIIRGDITAIILDSYLLMFNEVYKYYEEVLSDKSLLLILRQNLYLKIDPQLSKYIALRDKKNLPYKVQVMFKVVHEWGWTLEELKDIDDFESWDYNRIIQFWNYIKKFMLLSYQKISREMPAMNLKSKISESDFKLLSSKLKANFSIEQDKIENFITFKDTPNEPYLYIEPDSRNAKESGWRVYKKIRIDNSKNERDIAIKSEDDLVKLLAWCSINQVYEPTFSRLYIDSGYNHIDKSLITELLNKIFEMFNSKKVHLGNKFYLQPPRTYRNMIIMNFSDSKATVINSFYHLYINTWGETFLKYYTNLSDLVMIFSKVIKDGPMYNRNFDEFCFFVSPDPHKKLYKNIEKTFRNSYDFFVTGKKFVKQRLLISIDNNLVCATKEDKEISVASFSSDIELLSYVSQRPFRYPDNRVYSEDNFELSLIDEIYGKKVNNIITMVSEERQKYFIIYVIDENGNLFTFIKRKGEGDPLPVYYRFCMNTIANIRQSNIGKNISEDIQFYKLDVDKFGKVNFRDDSRNLRQLDSLFSNTDSGITIDVGLKEGKTLYSVRGGGFKSEAVTLAGIPDRLKALGKKRTSEIIEIKFHNFPHEKLEMGSTLYLYEKYRVEKVIGSIV